MDGEEEYHCFGSVVSGSNIIRWEFRTDNGDWRGLRDCSESILSPGLEIVLSTSFGFSYVSSSSVFSLGIYLTSQLSINLRFQLVGDLSLLSLSLSLSFLIFFLLFITFFFCFGSDVFFLTDKFSVFLLLLVFVFRQFNSNDVSVTAIAVKTG